MSKHTAGPWHVVGSEVWGPRVRVASGRGAYDEKDRERNKANARLISAAPDLLEALKTMLKGDEMGEVECQRAGFPRLIDRWKMAERAIAKAEGTP